MVTIYVLELENGKYYIGKTHNPQVLCRIDQHFNYNGSGWTQKYKPLRLVEVNNNCDNYDEDKYTLKYMSQHGIDNVRGGSFCESELSEDNKLTIQKMLHSSNNRC